MGYRDTVLAQMRTYGRVDGVGMRERRHVSCALNLYHACMGHGGGEHFDDTAAGRGRAITAEKQRWNRQRCIILQTGGLFEKGVKIEDHLREALDELHVRLL